MTQFLSPPTAYRCDNIRPPGFLYHPLCFSNSPHALTCPFMKSLSSNYPNWSVFSVIYLQGIYFWLQWVLVAVCRLSPVVARGAYSSWQGAGFSLWSLLLLWSPGSRHTGSDALVHRLSCSAAPGLFPDQGSNLCSLYKQVDSYPLYHQGSPSSVIC